MATNDVLLWAGRLMVAAGTAALITGTSAQAATLGQTVTNIASLSFEGDDGRVTVLTNAAEFIIEAERTESTIDFFRYSPNAPDKQMERINGSDYSPSGNLRGPFTAITPPSRSIGQDSGQIGSQKPSGAEPPALDFTQDIPLIPASLYHAGELMFVRVIDLGQNGNPEVIETVSIEVEATTGDKIVLRLYESGPDTGHFWAYVPSTRNATPQHDERLTTDQGTKLTATYVDFFDATEVSIDTALVDPYGRVFNGITGDLVSGARVTLIDYTTGQPAQVLGVDGFSQFPSSLIAGETVTDESGLNYILRPGEFQFPIVPAGEYVIQVEPPEGLSFASILSPEDFESLPTGPFTIETASYGRTFRQETTGPLNFDIPLDAESQFVISKTAQVDTGDVGDFIGYTVSVENRGQAGAPVMLRDTLPDGFRYLRGSARLGGQAFADPEVSDGGNQLMFDLGPLPVSESMELTYVLQIGAGAPGGEAVNSIVALNGNGEALSNTARASVTMREDLLRSRGTILGRVAEDACDGDADWARQIRLGEGVAGVRLYMETGAYAISDRDGLYHFEGVRPGTHVVQIDEETLPQGYTPMVCEESSRYAGSATSTFVEVTGGGLWRANFYLKQTGEKAKAVEDIQFNDRIEYKDYDLEWLETQSKDAEWVYPNPERTPSTPSVNIGIKHGPDERIALSLNGREVPIENFEARESNTDRSVMLSRWRGVNILEGRNEFVVTVKDMDGNVRKTLSREIHYVDTVSSAVAVPDQSVLIADGRTRPVLAVRLEDEEGRPIHAGRIVTVDVPAPYRIYSENRLEGADELVAPLSARTSVVAGADGLARIELEPTLQTGKVTVIVTLDDGRKVRLFMYLEPEKRDWILVGLAEGSAAYQSLSNASAALSAGAAEDLETDGRVAFFAKGLVKGNWLMTLAVDTDKRRGDRDGDFEAEIDPNAYYTLYGDRSYNEFEAQSRYPVYVKIEKKTFYAMFGDFDTNITEGKLTRYSRRLSGIKSEYLGPTFQAAGFAAETNQGFAKDELAADGTSGPYRLRNDNIIANSETVTIETRGRVRADLVLERRVLKRHLDYTIDNLTGEIIFRLPVDVSDSSFNPNVIVVDYETRNDAERNYTYGGRVQKQLLDGKVQLGSTFVHEGGDSAAAGAKSDMIGAEIIAEVSRGTEVRAEYALSRNTGENPGDESVTSKAYLAEIIHTSDKLTAEAYIQQEEGGFGLGQRASSTNEMRRYGANIAYQIQEFEDKDTGRRGERNVEASYYTEENLSTGDQRTLSEVNVTHDGDTLGLSAGLRQVKDEIVGGQNRESLQAVARARIDVPKYGASVQVTREQPLSSKDGVEEFPERTRFSLTKSVTEKANISITHDILDGPNNTANNTALGVSYAPWAGTSITAGSDIIATNSGRRVGATVGLDQQFQISPKWSLSGGLTNRRVLSETGTVVQQVAPDIAVSPLEVNEDYTAVYAGAGYRTATASLSTRAEMRDGAGGKTVTFSVGGVREMSEALSFAIAGRASRRDQDAQSLQNIPAGRATRIDGRAAVAWRPRDEGTTVLNRFDVSFDKAVSGDKTIKVVNNLAANTMVTDRWQLAAIYGVKYIETNFAGESYSGVTHLAGGETRFDLTERIDLGLNGSVLYSPGTDTVSYAYGPSVGVSPVDNVWISLGYNVQGYADSDFTAAEYSQKGPYLKFRFKFDQNTARGLLNRISPTAK